jgi:HSP20 family protein
MMWSMDPWRELDRMRRDLEGLLDPLARTSARRVFPPVNVYDNTEEIIVAAELPGLTKDDVKIMFADGVLVLSGVRKLPDSVEGMRPLRQERPAGRFEKSIEIPVRIDVEKISASFKSGVMMINLPKAAEARPKQVPIVIE